MSSIALSLPSVSLLILSLGTSLISPFSYTQLIWATAVGFVIFGHLPDQWTLTGAAIVVAAGLYLAFGERLRFRRR